VLSLQKAVTGGHAYCHSLLKLNSFAVDRSIGEYVAYVPSERTYSFAVHE